MYAEYEPPVSAVHPWARSYPGLQKDMPRYDLLNMPPWSLAFCDDITLAHKVKGGRPRMLLAYDCVTGGIRVKHERSKADHGPAQSTSHRCLSRSTAPARLWSSMRPRG